MMPTNQNDIPELDRVVFFDHQRLTARDLNDAAAVQRELRWLHNRSLHGWGIGLGFGVGGAKGDRQVTISPGYAVDCLGREMILTETLTKAVPARSGDSSGNPVIYYLVAAYPDDANLTVLEQRQGECDTSGAVRLQEQADVYWKEGSVNNGIEIVLAQGKVKDCKLFSALSLDQRRSARPLQQPYIAAGEASVNSISWELWQDENGEGDGEGEGDNAQILGVKATIDTSGARFGSTPNYQAQLWGARLSSEFASPPLNFDLPFMLDGTTSIIEASRNGFTLCVLLPRDLTAGSAGLMVNPSGFIEGGFRLLQTVTENWWVVWLGVEGGES